MIYLLWIIGITASFLIVMFKEAFRNEVKKEYIVLPSFPGEEPFSLFFISDIHRRIVHPSIIEEVKGKADLVIIGGDLAEKGVSWERIEQNIEALQTIAPVLFVWGNNDYELEQNTFHALLEKLNVIYLKNRSIALKIKGGEEVYLCGVDDLSKGKSDKEKTFKDVPPSTFKLLISHNPRFVAKLREEDQVSLVLSGHTHGGQIRLFGLGMYEKGGWRSIGNIKMLVSNGYGTTSLPLRLGARAETHLITIKKS
ncbi:MAG TPA: metallophosphoesterase [Chondromyces sp.]|nr:metallophosphoesterase [Chondromyces sp.]